MLSRRKPFGCEGCSSTQEGCWQKMTACGQTESECLQQQKSGGREMQPQMKMRL